MPTESEESRGMPKAEKPEQEVEVSETATDSGSAGPPAEEETLGEASVEALQEILAVQAEEVEVLKDQALRAQAEAENSRRRAKRDVEGAHKFALERFTTQLLPVIDSFERAVDVVKEVDDSSTSVEGLELSLKLLFDVLEKSGVKIVDPVGEPFDPGFHEAITMMVNPDMEPGSVMDVVQKGYVLNDRLVRAAKVIVAKADDNVADESV